MKKLDEIKKDYRKKYFEAYSGILSSGLIERSFEWNWNFFSKAITEAKLAGVKESGEKMLSEVLKVIPKEKKYDTEWDYSSSWDTVPKDVIEAKSFNQCRKQCIERIEELKK